MSRGGGPGGGSRPSPVPSMNASLVAQIDDLVQRNRTLEHTNKKLVDDKALDADRTKRVAREMQTKLGEERGKLNEERVVWREGCNRLLSSHHLAHLRLSAKLSAAQVALLKEMELSRQEKVARLHRDFQITMFRIREGELDAKVEELEDLLQEARRGHDSEFSGFEERVKAQAEEIGALSQEKLAVEKELLTLRENCGRLQVKTESVEAKLERVTLQFDGAKTDNAELERQNDELKRANIDIKRQLDKWQNLETKGGEEVETLRKQRIDLEVQVKALESRLEKKEAEVQKDKTKVTKLKKNVDEFEAYVEELRGDNKELESELAQAKKQIERFQRDLDAERAARAISPLKRQASPTVSEDEVANDFADIPPPSSPPNPPSKKPRSKASTAAPTKNGRKKPASEMAAGPSHVPDSDIEEVPDPKTRPPAKSKAPDSKAKPRSRTAGRESDGDDDARPAKNKGKGKAKAIEVDDSESDAAVQESTRLKTANRGKRKREDTASKRAPGEVAELPERPKPKPRGRAGSVQPRGTAVVSDAESDAPVKKKKRTIGIFPTNSQPTSFNFLTTGDAGGIDIPTILSPVRESDVVPNRSAAPSRTGSSGSVFGSLLSGFARKK